MNASDLPDSLQRFIQDNVPTFQSVEILLFLARHPGRKWPAGEIVEAIKPSVFTVSAVKEHLVHFRQRRLLAGDFDGGFAFSPASGELQAAVDELAVAYSERPVTLIRTIYALTENKIQSFADSFRLKKE